MNGVTVTMPLKDYERLKEKIKKLEEDSIASCITKEVHSFEDNTFTINVDEARVVDLICKHVKEKYNTKHHRLINRTDYF